MTSREDAKSAREFGKLLKLLRKGAGLSQEEFAERVGCSRTYPSLLELGKRTPKIFMFIRISRALGMSAATLVKMAERRLEVSQ